MTFTIIGRCEATGRLGIGISSYSLAVGSYCPSLRPGVGLVSSQAFVNPALAPAVLDAMEDGAGPDDALRGISPLDPWIDYRQVGAIDAAGAAACRTGPRTRPWADAALGDGHAAFGNALCGPGVTGAMEDEFRAGEGLDLPERLVRCLEAARGAGGQAGSGGRPLPERSAAVIVTAGGGLPDIDLRVDVHDDAVTELRRALGAYLPYAPYYELRRTSPAETPPQEEWPGG